MTTEKRAKSKRSQTVTAEKVSAARQGALEAICEGMNALVALAGDGAANTFQGWKSAQSLPEPWPSSFLDQEVEPLRRVMLAAVNSIRYHAEACQHAEAGRELAAWQVIAMAQHWLGCAVGLYRASRKDSPEAAAAAFLAVADHLKDRNRNAAIKGHASDHNAKAEALRLFAAHSGRPGYRSKDQAAGTIAGLVHRSPGTVRRWLIKA